ncbi:MAG: 2-isopropylmalate synthase [Omnitrophica bacterium GWA2_41_15]|nr:MAG: 2-isopropylmalate synthase [Omnitrophica bacterium GWA2_41_15]HAZ10265.1 2-isopropylmalate synthase [Candidatus Omnitrophota bacterium]
MKKIIIFDTTLRDGEQSPGASLDTNSKIEIARQLARLGVDVIEAGFPIASKGDFNAVHKVANTVKGASICGLARSIKSDIEVCAEAVKPARSPRIHVFLATSKIHMQYKLKKAESEILKLAAWAVGYARNFCDDVEFSPEDASRSDRDFLCKVIESVIKAGAKTVNIPDTVGYAMPMEFGSLIKEIKTRVPNIDKTIISVHCHNDLGMGVSNSLSAIENGAEQVECTINGIGERAGNASLEEIVMALETRKDIFGVTTSINKKELYKTSRLVSKLTGIVVQPNKAIVGQNAFAHESGIHQDGVLKKRSTYEIIKPQDVGFGGTRLVLGKHSGRHAFNERLQKLGFELDEAELLKAFERFKALADKKKEIFDEDLLSIVEDGIVSIPEIYRLDDLNIVSGNKITPKATIGLKKGARVLNKSSSGDGPVDACYKAIDAITGLKCKLLDYSLKSITGGKDALGEVSVRIKSNKDEVSGRGTSTDIIEASAKAYVNAVNKLIFSRSRKARPESAKLKL